MNLLKKLAVPLGFVAFFAWFFYMFSSNEFFRSIASKGDNIPIGMMIPIVAFFTYLALKEAFRHDRLIREGKRDKILDEMRK